MNKLGKFLWSSVVISITLAGTPSCRKPEEATKSELKEAGYQLTTDDWLRASRQNDVSAMEKFASGGFATDSRDSDGDSALHAAAAAGSLEAAEFLLNRGLAVDVPGASGRTPLMSAVLEDQTAMVNWLLRQGADPRSKDDNGFAPLMLAVRDGRPESVVELAAYHREKLDDAILLAALVGQAEVIDTLTNYGASVYARMGDGRTPLMIAAENGHTSSVELLLDIGSSRFSKDTEGHTASDLALGAGHTEIAAMITRDPLPGELALESPAEIAESMDAYLDAAIAEPTNTSTSGETIAVADSPTQTSPSPARPIDGEVLSQSVLETTGTTAIASNPAAATSSPTNPESSIRPTPSTSGDASAFPLPPLVMRHFREREVPIQIQTVHGETATLEIQGSTPREVTVIPGDPVPESTLVVVRVRQRMEDSKLNSGQPMEVSVVEVRDIATGTTREWISGVPSSAHDPVALVEDAATGQRYTATPGQRFKSADGAEFIITDVRPNQLIIEEAATGATQTIPLRGPRG